MVTPWRSDSVISVTPRLLPALVPLLLPEGHFVHELSGVTLPTTLTVLSSSGKRLHSEAGSTLCVPIWSVRAGCAQCQSSLSERVGRRCGCCWRSIGCLKMQAQTLDDLLQASAEKHLHDVARLTAGSPCLVCYAKGVGVDPQTPGDQLTRVQRKALVTACTQHKLPISGNRASTTPR